MNSQYGLKRMRQWMKDNSDWKHNIGQEEILPGDEGAIEHCERVREHSFDIRHAGKCVEHSQLCGPNGALLLPMGKGMCSKISNITFLEEAAILFADYPETGLFAQWREMQEKIREGTGFDSKKALCVKELCKYGGFQKAGLEMQEKIREGTGFDSKKAL